MSTVPKPFSREFREDVVRVARDSDSSVAQVANDFGISESCLHRWLALDDVEAGKRAGVSAGESVEMRELRKRNRLLEQENEVLRRAAAYLSQANLPGK
jgi:transposase-like protein